MDDTVYTLECCATGAVCGIYKTESSLCASLSSLKLFVPNTRFEAKKVLLGSNIVVNHFSQEDIECATQKIVQKVQNAGSLSLPSSAKREADLSVSPGEVLIKIPIEIRSEVKKVKEKYAVFVENLTTFRRLLQDKVVRLDMKISLVPELFRDKFYIFRDIVLNKVPDEDAFGYFMDRFMPNHEDNFVLETINEVSSDDDDDDDSSSVGDDDDHNEDEEERDSPQFKNIQK